MIPIAVHWHAHNMDDSDFLHLPWMVSVRDLLQCGLFSFKFSLHCIYMLTDFFFFCILLFADSVKVLKLCHSTLEIINEKKKRNRNVKHWRKLYALHLIPKNEHIFFWVFVSSSLHYCWPFILSASFFIFYLQVFIFTYINFLFYLNDYKHLQNGEKDRTTDEIGLGLLAQVCADVCNIQKNLTYINIL